MFLYKLECSVAGYKQMLVFILANDDLSAFDLAEKFVQNQFVEQIKIDELVLVEKKPVRPGAGFSVFPVDESE